MRTALFAASLALVAGTTVGCGGGPPTDASKEDFCGTFEDFYTEVADLDPQEDSAKAVEALKKIADKLEEVGTPEDMGDDARKGFELVISTINDLPDDASAEDLEKIDEEFSKEEQKQSDAFDEYLSKTCDGEE